VYNTASERHKTYFYEETMTDTATRPIIGIITSRYARTTGYIVLGIGENYVRAIEAAGGVPMLLHLTDDQGVLDALYRRCDALLFAGGEDVDPAHYGAPRHPKLGTVVPLRDEVELALARRAAAERKPMLGICRGIQVLNVALGGTLYQDIPAELPAASDHYATAAAGDRSATPHTMELAPGSWVAEQLGATSIAVNTLHHQSVRDTAPGLVVTGTSPDGVIEAFESAGDGFIVGVQCHPEELVGPGDPRWRNLFRAFVQVAAEASVPAA
jgi:putative glutamine amidotransferase